jgi:acetyltransferase-like isoleucine patch superfamily enzyme
VNEVARIASWPVIRLYFALGGIAWGSGWYIYGLPIIQRHRGSRISIGRDFEMRNTRASSPLGVQHPCILATWSSEAVIEIGRGVGVTGGAICSVRRIEIGDRVMIGANCTIVDSDFHPLDSARRMDDPASGASAPVIIEDDVFIGTQVMILKGTRIGKGSVVGAGSVVAGEIPPQVLVAGNPAQVLRQL